MFEKYIPNRHSIFGGGIGKVMHPHHPKWDVSPCVLTLVVAGTNTQWCTDANDAKATFLYGFKLKPQKPTTFQWRIISQSKLNSPGNKPRALPSILALKVKGQCQMSLKS